MKNQFCVNCHAPATCEHHIVPLVLGGYDIDSNKVSLCDKCHAVIHGITTECGQLSHSELVRLGMKKKKEALACGEGYYSRRTKKKAFTPIGRPKLTVDNIPEKFLIIYTEKKFKNITDLARQANMSRTTIYKYLELLQQAE